MIYDIIIIGGGPAGLSAALYVGKARLSNLIMKKQEREGNQHIVNS